MCLRSEDLGLHSEQNILESSKLLDDHDWCLAHVK